MGFGSYMSIGNFSMVFQPYLIFQFYYWNSASPFMYFCILSAIGSFNIWFHEDKTGKVYDDDDQIKDKEKLL